MIADKKAEGCTGQLKHPNPVGSTSESLKSYLIRLRGLDGIGGFDHGKTGVFVPGFDPIEFEKRCTVLFPRLEVRSRTCPDSEILNAIEESEREYSLFYSDSRGKVVSVSAGGSADEKD